MEGPDGMPGEEKVRLLRLPLDFPPPALAHAADSMKMKVVKNARTDKATKEWNLWFLFISSFLLKYRLYRSKSRLSG